MEGLDGRGAGQAACPVDGSRKSHAEVVHMYDIRPKFPADPLSGIVRCFRPGRVERQLNRLTDRGSFGSLIIEMWRQHLHSPASEQIGLGLLNELFTAPVT